jgi:hypothetical protein
LVNSGFGVELASALKRIEERIGRDAIEEKLDAGVIGMDPTIVPFNLDPSKIADRAVVTAFDKAGLDPKNPMHWNFLVYLFAFAHFGKWEGRRGRPLEWKGERYDQLQRDFDRIRKEKPTIASIEVCRLLKKRHPDKYSEPSPERLAKEIKKAYDPRFNPNMAVFLSVMIKALEEGYLRNGLRWSPEVEAEKTKDILARLLACRCRWPAESPQQPPRKLPMR